LLTDQDTVNSERSKAKHLYHNLVSLYFGVGRCQYKN